jgi:hypothetical protein
MVVFQVGALPPDRVVSIQTGYSVIVLREKHIPKALN